jgi:hypothetical protein
MLARLRQHAESVGDPCALAPPQYVFRWHTGHWHGQNAMRGLEDEGWYERVGDCEGVGNSARRTVVQACGTSKTTENPGGVK